MSWSPPGSPAVIPAALILGLGAACSDYNLAGADKGESGVDDGDADDTAAHGDTATDDTAEDTAEDTEPSCDGWEVPSTYSVPTDNTCQDAVPPGSFTPVVEWGWVPGEHPTYNQVMMTPVVTTLTDDNADGTIDGEDTPDVVFMSFSAAVGDRGTGVLRALDGATGAEHWSLLGTLGDLTGVSGIGAADVDNDGDVELFVCTTDHALLAVDHTGTEIWRAEGVCESPECNPSIHDLYGDGSPEIIVGRHAVDAAGTILWQGSGGRGASGVYGSMSFAADVDGDGELEVVTGNTVYEPDGTVRWASGEADGQPAIGDFGADGRPDIIVTTPSGMLRYDADSGAVVWGPTSFSGGGYGGPPTIADFDGDGEPEFGVAGRSAYVVHEGDGSVLWSKATTENSIAITGSAVFDFEGDGTAEVVYADETTLWVLDGVDGAVKLEVTDQASATVSEYPVVVDIDGDDEAELVLASNNYYVGGLTGITVFGDADHSWVDAGRTWNQHAFHQSHIDDDGRVPTHPVPSWQTHNSFRAGVTEGLPTYGLVDLAPGVEVCDLTCSTGQITAWFAVENQGMANAVAVALTIRRGDGSVVSTETATAVDSGDGVWVGPLTLQASDFDEGDVTATVDDDEDGNEAFGECDEDNNSASLAWPC
jgi:hypothetical protein